MYTKSTNVALALLFSLGITACSSGGSENPGQSVSEYQAELAATAVTEAMNTANTELTAAQKALLDAQSAYEQLKSANTPAAIQEILLKLNASRTEALKANTSMENAYQKSQTNTQKATSVLSNIDDYTRGISESAAKIKAIMLQIDSMINEGNTQFTNSIQKEVETITQAALAQVTTANQEINEAQTAIQNAQNATGSDLAQNEVAKAVTALAQTRSALENAKRELEKANAFSNETASVSAINEAKSAIDAAQKALDETQTTLGQAENHVTALIRQEIISNISLAENKAIEAANTAKAQVQIAQTAVTQATEAANKATTFNRSGDMQTQVSVAQVAAENAQNALKAAQTVLETATLSADVLTDNANSVSATTLATVQQAMKDAQLAVEQAQLAAEQAQSAYEQATQSLATLIQAEQGLQKATTTYSFNRQDSVVRDYLSAESRAAKLKDIQTDKIPDQNVGICANNRASICYAGPSNTETGWSVRDQSQGTARGTTLVSKAQAYSGYVGLRETYINQEDTANAFIALTDGINETKDKNVVTDANYAGTVSYSTGGGAPIATRLVSFNVKDDQISGKAYAINQRTQAETVYINFKEGNITVNDGTVGFRGEVEISGHPYTPNQYTQYDGAAAPKEEQRIPTGSYQGFFAGPEAQELVGTFEASYQTEVKNSQTNEIKTIENVTQGAFAASK
ncbi:hypothetical protein [Conservatibacter flavescens]|uniref:Transferrin-binding protein B C-lobe/N-lobe beta barrel domain-containing protein n=1 Tax=Conservatibacter flavescens TaxID=28161 RepID=A0A2M8S2K5_9PAST|nr:hypothetical protein [Conservatibacter flavescens]PJG85347.1 hypothetical protein CVP05_06375 [Conservatibacter flavescens]